MIEHVHQAQPVEILADRKTALHRGPQRPLTLQLDVEYTAGPLQSHRKDLAAK